MFLVPFSDLPATAGSAAPPQTADPGEVVDTTGDGQFVALAATPLLDTRSGLGTTQAAKIPAQGSVTFQVTGNSGIPATGVSAVALTVEANSPTAYGWLTVFPSDAPTGVSTITFSAGETTGGSDFTRITSTGQVTIANKSSGATHMVVSTRGYFLDASTTAAGDEYYPLQTAYLYDTRFGIGNPPRDTPVPAQTSVVFDVAGQQGIPASGASAVAVNVVATGQTQTGRVTLVPSDQPTGPGGMPFNPAESNSSLFVVPLTASGQLKITNHGAGSVDFSVTVRGFFMGASQEGGARFEPVSTTVILDTLNGVGTPGGSTTPLPAGGSVTFNATNFAGGAAPLVTAVALNINARHPTQHGYLTVYSSEEEDPRISSVIYAADGEAANALDLSIPSSEGKITVTNHGSGTVHVQISARGYFAESATLIEFSDVPDAPVAESEDVTTASGSRDYDIYSKKKYPWQNCCPARVEGTLKWLGNGPYANFLDNRTYDGVSDGYCAALLANVDGQLSSGSQFRACGNGNSKRYKGWIKDGWSVKFKACAYKNGNYYFCSSGWR